MLPALVVGGALAAPARPDLVPTALSVVQSGTTLHIVVTVRNRGSAAALPSVAGYYLGAVRLGASAVGRIEAAAVARSSATLVIPARVAPGRYRVRACADDPRRVTEANEKNNCLLGARTVSVADRTAPTFAGLAAATTCIPGPATIPPRSASYHLVWRPAADNATPADKLVYDVYQATTAGGENFSSPTYTTPAGATSFSTPALPGDKTYYFVVRARDPAGNRDANTVERQGQNLCV